MNKAEPNPVDESLKTVAVYTNMVLKHNFPQLIQALRKLIRDAEAALAEAERGKSPTDISGLISKGAAEIERTVGILDVAAAVDSLLPRAIP